MAATQFLYVRVDELYRKGVRMEVPVTEYRRRLAHYHALAREGEPITVTERGQRTVQVTALSDEDVLAALAADGSVRRALRPRSRLALPLPYSGAPAEEQLAAERR